MENGSINKVFNPADMEKVLRVDNIDEYINKNIIFHSNKVL